jgi:hypothetical protein
MNGRSALDHDQGLRPTRGTRQDRQHRRERHARVDPTAEDHPDPPDGQRRADEPVPPESLLPMGQGEGEGEQWNARE